MREFWLLFKTNLSSRVINRYGKNKKKNVKKKSSSWVIFLVYGFIFLFVLGYSFFFGNILKSIDRVDLLLLIGLLAATLLTLVGSIPESNAYLFGAKDFDLLLSLPIKSRTIVASKISSMWFMTTLIYMCFMIPISIVYGIYVKPAFYFYLIMIIVILVGSALVITIGMAFGYLFNLLTSKMKHKNVFKTILGLVFFFALMIGYMSLINIDDTGMSDAEVEYLMKLKLDNVANVIYTYILPIKWAMQGLKGDMLNLLFFVLVNVVPFSVAILIVGNKFIHMNSIANRSYRNKKFRLEKQKSIPVSLSLLKREFKRLISTPMLAINVFTGAIMSTIMVLVMLINIKPELESEQISASMFPFLILCITIFFNGIVTCTSSSISLEGKQFWIIKSSPIDAKTVLISKILLGVLSNLPFIVINAILGLVLGKFELIFVLLMIIVPTLMSVFTSTMGLYMNILLPKLDYENPVMVVKQGASVLATMAVNSVAALVVIGLIIISSILRGPTIAYFVAIITSVLFSFISLFIIFKHGKKKYLQIEC